MLPLSYWRAAVRRQVDWDWYPPAWLQYAPAPTMTLLHWHARAAVLKADPAAVAILAKLLDDEDCEVVTAACMGLGNTECPQAARVLAHALLSERPGASAAAYHALRAMGPAKREVVHELCEVLTAGDQPARHLAAQCLHLVGEAAVPDLLGLLGDSAVAVRIAACEGLGGIDVPTAGRALAWALCDADPRVREQAWRGLGGWIRDGQGEEVVPVLCCVLASGERVGRVLAADVLSEIGPKALGAVPALLNASKNPDPLVRKYAQRALRAVDSEAALAAGIR